MIQLLLLAAVVSDGGPTPGLTATPEGVALAGAVTGATLSAAGQEFDSSFCAHWHERSVSDPAMRHR